VAERSLVDELNQKGRLEARIDGGLDRDVGLDLADVVVEHVHHEVGDVGPGPRRAGAGGDAGAGLRQARGREGGAGPAGEAGTAWRPGSTVVWTETSVSILPT
jgi:hypothetical protein